MNSTLSEETNKSFSRDRGFPHIKWVFLRAREFCLENVALFQIRGLVFSDNEGLFADNVGVSQMKAVFLR